MSRSRGYDQILDVEFRKVFRGDGVIADDRNGDTEETDVLVEVVGEGVEVINQQHFYRDRKLGREGFFCCFRFSVSFGSGCGCRLSRFGGRLRHNLGKKSWTTVGDGSGS